MAGSSTPQATVLLTTFNHERWIGQAIESVLMQRTTFDVEFVVREDYSSDRTREIVLEYAHRFPDRITLDLSASNANSHADWLRSIRNAKAPYVAFLDGDDYWTHEGKLQWQVDFLRQFPACSMCAHNANVVNEDNDRSGHCYVKPGRKQWSTLPDILSSNFVPTCSAMVVKRLVVPMPAWLERARWWDWSLYVSAALRGPIGYVDEVMATYRRHPGGVWTGLTRPQQVAGLIEFLEQMNANLNFEQNDLITRRIAELRDSLTTASS
jgi:glycosyltransferase involved in cell wall biosynthesis